MSERPTGLNPEYLLSPELYPVTSRIIEMRTGQRVGTDILTRIGSPDISRVVMHGEPGTAKTTFLSELLTATRSLNEITGAHSQILTYTYDTFLASEQKRNKLSYDYWTPDLWARFNVRIHDRLEENALPGIIQFIELPGVGYTNERDRGVSCMRLLAQDSRENNNNTLFLFMVRNRFIQDKAGMVRGAVKDIPDEEVVSFLRSNNIFIKGVEEGKKGGKAIKKHFRKMGDREHIKKIRSEETSMATLWLDRNLEEAGAKVSGIIKTPLITLEEYSEVLSRLTGENADVYAGYSERQLESRMDDVGRNAAFAGHRLGVELGVPPDNYYLLGNHYTEDPTTIDFSQFRSKKKKAA